MKQIQAIGHHVFVIRDEPEKEMGGFIIPDQAQQKPNTGDIISVGSEISDANVKKGRKAIFNKQVGFEILLEGSHITVLREDQVLGVLFVNNKL